MIDSSHMELLESGIKNINFGLSQVIESMKALGNGLTAEADDCLKLVEEIEALKLENAKLRNEL